MSAGESTLVEFKTVQIALILLDLMKFRQVLADVIAYAEFALRSDYLVIFLIFQLFPTKRVITLNLSALLLMGINLTKLENLLAIFAAYSK